MSGTAKTLVTHAANLERVAKEGKSDECEAIVDELSKCEMTIDLLRTTKIGLRLRGVAKDDATPDAIQKRCKTLVKKWRNEFVGTSQTDSPPTASSETKHAGGKRKLSDACSPVGSPAAKRKLSRQSSCQSTMVPQDLSQLVVPRIEKTGDLTRDKCRSALWKALNAFMLKDDDMGTKQLCEQIEEAIHDVHKTSGPSQYKMSIKSKCSNLKDAKNNLRLRVLSGRVTPKMLAKMTPADMASEEVKKQNVALAKLGMNDALAPDNSGATTDAFKCGKCGKRQCTYYEKQTRSADEPMTVFITCQACGNKWRN